MASKENIYSSIQNLYNMDKNTWQEVLAEMYNLIYQNESKFEVIETKFDIHLNETVKNSLIDSIENGDFNELIENICKKIIESNGGGSSCGQPPTIKAINVRLNANDSYTISNDAIEETINLQWEGSQEESVTFYNGATGTFPYNLTADTTVQMGTEFYKNVLIESYEKKGSDPYGSIIGYINLNVGDGDELTVGNGVLYDLDGNPLSTVTSSGYYCIYKSGITENSYMNKGTIKSNLGTSSITNIVMQSKGYLDENYPNFSFSITNFIAKFPPSLIGVIQPGQSTSNSTEDIFAKATINGEEITNKTESIAIKKGDVIICTKGVLSFSYNVISTSQTESPSYSTNKDLSNYKWACIGDSYTDTTINADYKYCQIIGDVTKIKVQYLGKGGTGWWKGYDTQTSFRYRASQVSADTDIVTIFGSINDWKYYQGDSPLTIGTKTDSLPTENTLCAYINDVFDVLEQTVPNAQIIVFSPMYYHGLSARVSELFNAVKECTENRGYEFVDMLHTGWYRIENNATYAQNYCTDYSASAETYGHPNNLAHKTFIAPKFYHKLLEYLPIK